MTSPAPDPAFPAITLETAWGARLEWTLTARPPGGRLPAYLMVGSRDGARPRLFAHQSWLSERCLYRETHCDCIEDLDASRLDQLDLERRRQAART